MKHEELESWDGIFSPPLCHYIGTFLGLEKTAEAHFFSAQIHMALSLPRIHKKRQGNKERSRTFSRPHIRLGIALQVSTPFPTAAIRCCSGERGSLRHVVPSCPSPAPTAPHWGESRGQMSFENQFPAHSLAAQSSNFEGRGEQLHISCFSCRCDLARHVLVPPQSSSL